MHSSLLEAAVFKAYRLVPTDVFPRKVKVPLDNNIMPLVCFVLFRFFPQTYLNLFIQRNVVTFKIITPSGSMFISYKSILLLSTSFKNLFNLFNNSTLEQKKGTLKKQMFTFTPKFLHNLKHFPITFLSLLDYNFYTEVLMKTILSQLDCTIY